MLAFKSVIFIKFIWREATTRKSEGFTSLALNSYVIFYKWTKIIKVSAKILQIYFSRQHQSSCLYI